MDRTEDGAIYMGTTGSPRRPQRRLKIAAAVVVAALLWWLQPSPVRWFVLHSGLFGSTLTALLVPIGSYARDLSNPNRAAGVVMLYIDKGRAPADAIPALVGMLRRDDAPNFQWRVIEALITSFSKANEQSLRNARAGAVLTDIAIADPDLGLRYKAIDALQALAHTDPSLISPDEYSRVRALRPGAEGQMLDAIDAVVKTGPKAPARQ